MRVHTALCDHNIYFSETTAVLMDMNRGLRCRCGDDCANTFRLRYKGQYATISPSMSAEEVADGIMALSSVKVSIDVFALSLGTW